MLSAYKNTAYVLLGGALCKAWQLIFSCFPLCALVKRCFQSYNNLPQYTALENVALPLAIRGVPEDERNWLAWQALSRVGLRGHVDHRPAELSGGQQQRVSIARAIITEPSIVLADEPTGNLDSRTGQEVMELLCEIFRERNTTFVLSSHDPQMALYTDRTVYFSDGKIETENHHTGEERTQ